MTPAAAEIVLAVVLIAVAAARTDLADFAAVPHSVDMSGSAADAGVQQTLTARHVALLWKLGQHREH